MGFRIVLGVFKGAQNLLDAVWFVGDAEVGIKRPKIPEIKPDT